MNETRNGNAQAFSLSAPRTPAGQSGVRFVCQSTSLAAERQGGPAPFDRRVSRDLDRWEKAQGELVLAFQGVRRESADCPNARHLPRLLAVVWAFAETVNNIRLLEDGVGI